MTPIVCNEPTVTRFPVGKNITGVLLHYSDGRRACVGSVRLDLAGTPLDVQDRLEFFLGYRLSKRRNEAFATRIELEVPEGSAGLEWRAVPLEGKFEWWLSRQGRAAGDHGRGEAAAASGAGTHCAHA